jgi:pyruvate/2-oxoglutarate dehydrogenase complex dihydrolipoamide dehydrogenase (E3) component
MPQPEHYQMLVLGSGEGGKFLAWHMARSGHRTAVIERRLIGGSCPNTNCLPSKNEIWSAKVADLVHHADRFGMATGPTTIDMPKVLARKRAMVDGLIAMHLDQFKASGAELIIALHGPARCDHRSSDEIAAGPGKGWISFAFKDPITRKVLPKENYVEKAGDYTYRACVYTR